MSTTVQCDDGSYINADLVYRWSITEDVTADGHIVQAHVAGPQRPFLVCTRETRESAETVLKAILELATRVIPGGRSATDYHQMPPYGHR